MNPNAVTVLRTSGRNPIADLVNCTLKKSGLDVDVEAEAVDDDDDDEEVDDEDEDEEALDEDAERAAVLAAVAKLRLKSIMIDSIEVGVGDL